MSRFLSMNIEEGSKGVVDKSNKRDYRVKGRTMMFRISKHPDAVFGGLLLKDSVESRLLVKQ